MSAVSVAGFVVLRCNGCRRQIGIGPVDKRVYCDALCAIDFPAVATEERDALLVATAVHTGATARSLAAKVGLTPQRLVQILGKWRTLSR